MNHSEVIISLTPHVELNIFHRENGRVYTIGETNSISGDGSYGVSDVFVLHCGLSTSRSMLLPRTSVGFISTKAPDIGMLHGCLSTTPELSHW